MTDATGSAFHLAQGSSGLLNTSQFVAQPLQVTQCSAQGLQTGSAGSATHFCSTVSGSVPFVPFPFPPPLVIFVQFISPL